MHHTAAFASLLLSAVLAACGGGITSPEVAALAGTAPPEAQLLRNDWGRGQLGSRNLQPLDPAARTRNGLYATRDQYEWEALTLSPNTVLLDVDTFGSVSATVQYAQQIRDYVAAGSVTFFVTARNPVAAAEVVNTLCDTGLAPVVMIV
jgi:hypothetical protein